MKKVAKFRLMRLSCDIRLCEVAKAAKVSPQRLGQLEIRYYGMSSKDPERFIIALETVIARRRRALDKIDYICKHERKSIFKYVDEREKL